MFFLSLLSLSVLLCISHSTYDFLLKLFHPTGCLVVVLHSWFTFEQECCLELPDIIS